MRKYIHLRGEGTVPLGGNKKGVLAAAGVQVGYKTLLNTFESRNPYPEDWSDAQDESATKLAKRETAETLRDRLRTINAAWLGVQFEAVPLDFNTEAPAGKHTRVQTAELAHPAEGSNTPDFAELASLVGNALMYRLEADAASASAQSAVK